MGSRITLFGGLWPTMKGLFFKILLLVAEVGLLLSPISSVGMILSLDNCWECGWIDGGEFVPFGLVVVSKDGWPESTCSASI